MQIAHLAHSGTGIRCSKCGTHFEVRSSILANPVRLVEWKESLAAKHTCRKVTPRRSDVRVLMMPAGDVLARYWTENINKALPVQ